jgi:predicted oxidoreductase
MAYGCWRLAGSEGSESDSNDQYTYGIRAVLAAAEAGFSLFDLADIYGRSESERIFGAALKESPGLRDRINVASKCGIRRAGDPGPDAPYRYDFSTGYILQSVEGSLKRMGIEHLDLLMLHRPDYLMQPEEVAQAFAQLKAAGKVKEFGISNFSSSQASLLQKHCDMPLVVHQIEISLWHQASLENGLLDQCRIEGITPMAWSPLARGFLASPHLRETERGALLAAELERVAARYATTPAVVALAWLLRLPGGVLPVIGSTNPQHIQESVRALEISLDRESWYRLTELARGSRLP